MVTHYAIFDDLRTEVAIDTALQALCDNITSGKQRGPWAIQDGLATFKGWIYIPSTSTSLPIVLSRLFY